MATDPAVLAALADAVQRDPDNGALRLHYAQLLLAANKAAEALDQAANILARQPDHLEALGIAAEAADAAGDKIRAQSYRNLQESLRWNKTKNLIEGATGELPPLPDEAPKRREPSRQPEPRDRDEDGSDDRHRIRLGGESQEEFTWDTERPEITLDQVAGLEAVKKRLHLSFLGPMRNPDMRKLYGKSLRGGLLLYGPPGCGKTYIARAVAGELGARFLAVGLTDVVDMFLGESEKNLHSIFEAARRNPPCVLFIDEIDALGRKRSQMRHDAGRTIINQLLHELDGAQHENEGVYVLAATNSPWDVDAALRRPGRLDRTILVLPPDPPARVAIVKNNLQDRPQENIDAEWIASKTEDFSGADIAHLVESAAELAMEDSIKKGQARPIRMDDFKRALKEVKPSIRPWLETARNYVVYANEAGTYDELADYLRIRRLL